MKVGAILFGTSKTSDAPGLTASAGRHDRQWLDISSYHFGSILRLRNCLRDDARNRIAVKRTLSPASAGRGV
jgi:hypothetical protein